MLEEKALRDVLEIYDSGVTWADRMREKALTEAREQGLSEGRVKGLAEGRVEGRAEGVPAGERRLLLRQLELRFGPLPETARKRVDALDAPKDLEDLGERLLTAKSLGDLGLSES
jgi:predicted transposase YdaD